MALISTKAASQMLIVAGTATSVLLKENDRQDHSDQTTDNSSGHGDSTVNRGFFHKEADHPQLFQGGLRVIRRIHFAIQSNLSQLGISRLSVGGRIC